MSHSIERALEREQAQRATLKRVRELLAEWDADVMITPDSMHTHSVMRNELRRALGDSDDQT